jgi:hypothetical protein
MWECNGVNKVVLMYISAFVGFLRKIVTPVYRYEQDKVQIFCFEFLQDQSRNTKSKGGK